MEGGVYQRLADSYVEREENENENENIWKEERHENADQESDEEDGINSLNCQDARGQQNFRRTLYSTTTTKKRVQMFTRTDDTRT